MGELPRDLVILRACADDPDGNNAEARLGVSRELTQEVLDELRVTITDLYRQTFGEEPGRVGVAVLPWVNEVDGDDESPGGEGA